MSEVIGLTLGSLSRITSVGSPLGLCLVQPQILDPVWVLTCGGDLKSNQKMIGYSHDIDATVATVGASSQAGLYSRFTCG